VISLVIEFNSEETISLSSKVFPSIQYPSIPLPVRHTQCSLYLLFVFLLYGVVGQDKVTGTKIVFLLGLSNLISKLYAPFLYLILTSLIF